MQLDSSINGQQVTLCGRAFPLNVWDPSQDTVLGKQIALDTETELIVDQTFPHLVLLQVCAGGKVDLVRWEDAELYMLKLFRYNPHSLYFMVNAAYDMGVLNMGEFYNLVDSGQVVNLQDRYKLWEISEKGYVRKPDSLANMTKQVLGAELPKDNELRLTFKRDKSPSIGQLAYGAKDVVATWMLATTIPAMPTEADSQIMGSIVLDAISRVGMLVDQEYFDKLRAKYVVECKRDLEFLELRGYSPLLSKTSAEVLQDGFRALDLDIELDQALTGPPLEYLILRMWTVASLPLEQFKARLLLAVNEIKNQECCFLSNREYREFYIEQTQADYEGKLKRDRVAKATDAITEADKDAIFAAAENHRINPFKGKNRKRLNDLVRGILDTSFMYDHAVHEPQRLIGLGLHDMARDKKLCRWPMASILRELFRAKAGKVRGMPEFSVAAFREYIQERSMWYGNYSTEWADCMKAEAFMQARFASIERKNPGVVFSRTAGGKTGKGKQKIQVSKKDKWIFTKYNIKDEMVETYISYKHSEKMVSTYLNPSHIRADGRVHTRFENYLRTGRTSSSKPNIQNVPGSGGLRDMYIPKPMHVYASVDYSQLELCSLAQHCYTVYGHSRMRDIINANIDLHSWFAGKTMGMITDENDYDGSEESRLAVIVICNDIKKNHNKKRQNAKACYSADTELLTPTGWKRIDALYGTKIPIAQYCPHTKRLLFVEPLAWTQKEHQVLVRFTNDYTDALVTPNHRMLRISRAGVVSEIPADQLEPSAQYSQVHGGDLPRTTWISPAKTRLAVMVQADGSFTVNACRLGFSKKRKIQRCRQILVESQIGFTEHEHNGIVTFRFLKAQLEAVLTEDKHFLQWAEYNQEAFIGELCHWDGSSHANTKHTKTYFNTSKEDAATAQLVLVTSGYKATLRQGVSAENRKPIWMVTWYMGDNKKNPTYARTSSLTVASQEGRHTVYCPTVPSSWVLTRRNGKVLVAGNCNFGFPGGMSAETFLKTQRGYGNIEITLEECQPLRDAWFEVFPEMAEHMKPVADVVTEYDRERLKEDNLRLFKAKNIAGVLRRKCSFNSACNYPFQSLAAFGAKRALWAVWRDGRYAKYMVNFVHDEILFELPAETAAEDVLEIQKIMEDAMKIVIPDVRIATEGCLMYSWDKEAEPVFDMFGNLIVWRPEAA